MMHGVNINAPDDMPAGTKSRLGTAASSVISVFFFQAEDGIRDYKVTGVQTCALPIFVGDVIRAVEPPPPPPSAVGPALTGGALADSIAAIEKSPDFAEQKQRFAADLVRTGRMSQARADSVARFAVREAFLRGIPPAVIFGVMLTENAQFISRAQSNVGAVGLMQVYPKVWLKALSAKFGAKDIAADSTNLRYGVFILSNYLKPH